MRLMASSPSMQSPRSRATRAGWRARAGFSKASPASVRGLPCRLEESERAGLLQSSALSTWERDTFTSVSPRYGEGTQSQHLRGLEKEKESSRFSGNTDRGRIRFVFWGRDPGHCIGRGREGVGGWWTGTLQWAGLSSPRGYSPLGTEELPQ